MSPIRISFFIPSPYHILRHPHHSLYSRSRTLCTHMNTTSEPPRIWRPTVDDVDRLSRGLSTRNRGVGSRAVPHRLNLEERTIYERAQRNGYLEVYENLGYRRERKGSPLVNIWRQWCDCHAVPSIMLVKSVSGKEQEKIVVDLSTLRGQRFELMDSIDSNIQSLVQVFDRIVDEKGEIEDDLHGDTDNLLDVPIWKVPVVAVVYGFGRRDIAKKTIKKLVEFLRTSLQWKGVVVRKDAARKRGRKRDWSDDHD